jgi:hypothetical protein
MKHLELSSNSFICCCMFCLFFFLHILCSHSTFFVLSFVFLCYCYLSFSFWLFLFHLSRHYTLRQTMISLFFFFLRLTIAPLLSLLFQSLPKFLSDILIQLLIYFLLGFFSSFNFAVGYRILVFISFCSLGGLFFCNSSDPLHICCVLPQLIDHRSG